MKKILISMMTIAMVSAMIGGGIYAAFSDTESSPDNMLAAGTLDLSLGGQNEAVTLINIDDAKPGSADVTSVTLKNVGNVDADLTIDIGSVTSTESTGIESTSTEDDPGLNAIEDTSLDALDYADDYFIGWKVMITESGHGAEGETRYVTDYADAGGVITVNSNFSTEIDSGVDYALFTEFERDNIEVDSTATGAGTGNNTLADTAVLTQADDYWNGYYITIWAGTGADQTRIVTDFVHDDNEVIVNADWGTNPDNTSKYFMYTNTSGTATAGGAATLTDTALIQDTGYWNGFFIEITAGTSAGDTREITGFDANVITVDSNWSAIPDTTSEYRIYEIGTNGELESDLTAAIWINVDGDVGNVWSSGNDILLGDGGSATQPGAISRIAMALYSGENYTDVFALTAGSNASLVVDYLVADNDYNYRVEGDALNFDIDFTLNQQ